MVDELNEDVEILGRTFRFRTRLTGEAGLSIQTEVLLEGKVVATREATFEGGEKGDAEVALAWMKEHHRRVFEMFIARALRYQRREAYAVPPPLPVETPPTVATGTGAAPPSAAATPALVGALRVRRYFAGFSKQMGSCAALPPEDVDRRLLVAARALDWMIRSDHFAEIRVDEQVRCHLLKEEIDDWLDGSRDPAQAARIWAKVTTFQSYLAEINKRAELVAFDHRMLAWALDEIRRRGMAHDVLRQLAALYGFLPGLNRLLDDPADVSDDTWIAQLRLALTLTDPRAVSPFDPKRPPSG